MVLAEVMDKEFPLAFLQYFFFGFGAIGFSVAIIRWWLCLPVFLLIVPFGLVHISELYDPNVGPAILAEAGREYVVQSHLAILAGGALPILGIILGWIFRNWRAARTVTSGSSGLTVRA